MIAASRYTLKEAQNDGEKMGPDSIVIANDYFKPTSQKIGKIFTAYPSWSEFWKKYQKLLKTQQLSCYEFISEEKPCRLYADLDWNKNEYPRDEEWVQSKFINIVEMCLASVDPDTIKKFEKGHCFTSSSRDAKGSLHYCNSKVSFMTGGSHLKFMNIVFNAIKNDPDVWFLTKTNTGYSIKCFIDFCVYNNHRQMRLIGSSKMNSQGVLERPLVSTKNLDPTEYVITWPCETRYIDTRTIDHVTQIQCRRRPVFDEDFLEEIVSKHPGLKINTIKDPYKGSKRTIITTRATPDYECSICGNRGDYCHPYFISDETRGVIKKKCHSASSGDKEEIVYIQENDSIDHNNSFNDILKRLVREFYTTFKDSDKDSEHYVETKNIWLNSALRFMNKYVVKIEAAKPCVNIRKFRENLTGQSQIGWEMMAAMDFIKSYCEYKIEGDPLAKLWFESTISGDNKRSFTVCNPSVNDIHAHNTFSGIHISYIDSLKGDLKKGKDIADFIKRVWCDNDDTIFDYTIKWLAWQVQNPGQICETAIFIRGSPGSGKSSIINMLLEIIGHEHSVATSDTENVFGNFNSLLRSKFLCYLDEAVFAGDKKVEGKIKAAITEPTRLINIKGIPQYSERNCTNFIASSNNEHFLRVEEKSRRFLVLETSDEMLRWDNRRKGDLLDNGSLNFARYLYEVDLNGWERRNIPNTEALKTQRAYCMSPMNNWLVNLANSLEYIELNKHVSLVELYQSYSVYDRHTNLAVFSKKLRKINYNGKPLFSDEKRLSKNGKRTRAIKTPDENLLEKYNINT